MLKKYPEKFKKESVDFARSNPSKTYAELAKELGIPQPTLCEWCRKDGLSKPRPERFSESFKDKAVKIRISNQDKETWEQTAMRFGVDSATLFRWCKGEDGINKSKWQHSLSTKLEAVNLVETRCDLSYKEIGKIVGASISSVCNWCMDFGDYEKIKKREEAKSPNFLPYNQIRAEIPTMAQTCRKCFYGSTFCNKLKDHYIEMMALTAQEAEDKAKKVFKPSRSCLDFSGKDFLK